MIHSGPRRVAFLAPLFCFSIVCLLTDSSGALSRQPQATLTAGSVIEREIGGDEKHVYLLPLIAGQFARIVVEQPAVDVVLSLLNPAGRPAAEVNNYLLHEPESLSLIAETNGQYLLSVSAADSKAARANYKISVEDWRASTPRDSQFVDAERKFSEATQLWRRGRSGPDIEQPHHRRRRAIVLSP